LVWGWRCWMGGLVGWREGEILCGLGGKGGTNSVWHSTVKMRVRRVRRWERNMMGGVGGQDLETAEVAI